MSHLKLSLRTLIPFGLLLALNACSFSTSSESVSDLASSPSSLSSSTNTKKYMSDVTDYTYAYLKSTSEPTDYADFQKGLSDIAEEHGISDWESDTHTYQAIGKALKKAHIAGVAYQTYQKNFADGSKANMRAIQEGYDSVE